MLNTVCTHVRAQSNRGSEVCLQDTHIPGIVHLTAHIPSVYLFPTWLEAKRIKTSKL